MLSQSIFPAISKDSSFKSPLYGQRILSYKIPQLPLKLSHKSVSPNKPLNLKQKPSEILPCLSPPNSNRFKYSRLSIDESYQSKRQKVLISKPLRQSFDAISKKSTESSELGKNEKMKRITIFNRGPNELSTQFFKDEESDSEESVCMENKIYKRK